jgi:hypothetical protein
LRIKILSVAFLLIVVMISCEPIPHNFSAEELKQIDSLYQLKKDSIELMMEEECDSVFQLKYKGIVDSLSEIRKKEIFDIIGR